MKKEVVFKESKIIDNEEYVKRSELDRDYDLKKTHRLFEVDKTTGEKRRIPGSWKRLFYIDWMALLLVAVVVFSFFMYQGAVKECKVVMENPCNYCSGQIFNYTNQPVLQYNNTLTNNNIQVNGAER